jgi:hypothetical protein
MTAARAVWQGADAFTVLGLPYSPDLTDRDVRAAYLLRMRAAHPDNGGDADAAKAVQAAYEALRSGVRRGEVLAGLMSDRGLPPSAHDLGTGTVPDAAQREDLRRRVAASRAAQGLPPHITDAAVLDKIADLLVVMLGRADQRQRAHPRPLSAAGPRPDNAGSRLFETSTWRRLTRRRYMAEHPEPAPQSPGGGRLARGWARVRHGRPAWLAARIVLTALVLLVAAEAAPGDPAVPAVGIGALTWLVLRGRLDLAPPARPRPKRGRRWHGR